MAACALGSKVWTDESRGFLHPLDAVLLCVFCRASTTIDVVLVCIFARTLGRETGSRVTIKRTGTPGHNDSSKQCGGPQPPAEVTDLVVTLQAGGVRRQS